METKLGRRNVLAGGLALGGLATGGSLRQVLAQTAPAATAPTVNIITWGGPWIKALTPITAKQHFVNVNWSLHTGGAATVIAKLKATWPQHDLDAVHAFPPVFYGMLNQDWLEPIPLDQLPNMSHVPAEMPVKNPQGQPVDVPVSSSGQLWLYDEADIGMKIEKPDDLLSPKMRGKLLMYAPTFESGAFLVCLARAHGGSERNIDPGFEFAKELAKAKVVGRVAKSDVEVINAYTTREVSAGMVNLGGLSEVRKHRKMTLLNKVPNSPMFKTYLTHEGFAVLKGARNAEALLAFLNFLIGPEINAEYAPLVGQLPVNEQSSVPTALSDIQLRNAEERKDYAAYFDYRYIAQHLDEWNQRWEREVTPILQG